MPRREDWLLLFVGLPGGDFCSDQIRVMKGMFLFSKEGPGVVRDLYSFTPYDYGPFDTQVYRDLDTLEVQGFVRVEPIQGTSRHVFRLTAKGEQRMVQLLGEAPGAAVDVLGDIKKLVTSRSFLDLLRYVYEKYPAYASQSVVRP
jgi:DNA-binding PadR family transcriptional regulator